MESLRSINRLVAKIIAMHTGGNEAKRVTSDVTKGLEGQLLLAKGSHIMLTANIWTKGVLVNRAIEIVYDILYED